jgi:hypothetical protein
LRFKLPSEVAAGNAGGVQALGFGHSGADDIAADLPRPSSWARDRMIAFTAALLALCTDMFGGADAAAPELMLMMLPPGRC